MTPAIKKLQLQVHEWECSLHPTVPAAHIPLNTYTDKTANGLTRCIVDFIRSNGGQAERINTTGMPIIRQLPSGRTETTWRKGNTTKGSADISAIIDGKSVKIEVKIGPDRQSEAQKKYQKAVEAAGGMYFIAKSFDDFLTFYNNNFKNINYDN